MKKITSVLCAVLMCASMLGGCGSSDSSSSDSKATTTKAAEDASANDGGNGGGSEDGGEETPADKPVLADNSVDYAANMKLGWNLGNTLDAIGGSGLDSEVAWGQPYTTKELIQFVKDSGFDSIRIPVSWGQHTDDNYQIDGEWMARVKEIVQWAYDSGLYIILNSHHDNDFYYPTEEHYEKSEEYIKAIWAQIAEEFKDFDEQLIFESMNEPRLAGTNKEWWFNDSDPEGVESIQVISKLNQVFVDTVRATGGNNATRFLMVPSNAAAVQNALNSAFTLPNDTAENRIILSVHAYTPYDFAMNFSGGTAEWTRSGKSQLSFMDNLNEKFIQNGVGVVIGEFGATNKGNDEARVEWAKDYVGKAKDLGIACVLWDNGGIKVGDENFGMIDRTMLTIYFPQLLQTMVDAYK